MTEGVREFIKQIVLPIVAGVALISCLFIAPMIWWEGHTRSAERRSIEPGILTDTNGNRFRPAYICPRGSCFWALERLP